MLCREGRGKPPAPPRSSWEQGKRRPRRGTCPCCPCCLDTAGPSAARELQRLHSARAVPQAAWKGGAEQARALRSCWSQEGMAALYTSLPTTLLTIYTPWPPMRSCHRSSAPLPGSLSFWDKGWVLFLSFRVNFQHRSAVEQSRGSRCTWLDRRSIPSSCPSKIQEPSHGAKQFALPISWDCPKSQVILPLRDLEIAVSPPQPSTFPVPAPSHSSGKSRFCPFPLSSRRSHSSSGSIFGKAKLEAVRIQGLSHGVLSWMEGTRSDG